MTEQLTRVMVPAEHVISVNDLGKTALFNVAPDIKTIEPDMVVEVTGLWRTRTQYRLDLKLSSPSVLDTLIIDVDKDRIESRTLAMLDSFPPMKW